MNKKTIFSFFIFLNAFTYVVQSQSTMVNSDYRTLSIDEQIKSMRIYINGNELSYPILELGSDNRIIFEYDLLGIDARNYVYQIMHCNAKWQKSDLFSDEFMDGFNENNLSDYEFSANTKVNYIHYKLEIPNSEVDLKVSGNYIIRVFEEGKRDTAVATARFSLYEPIVNVKAEIKQPTMADQTNSGQEVRLSVLHDDFQIDDPFNEISINILQNNRPDRMITDIKPTFVRNNELIYSFSGENVLPGGNEYRMFNIRDFKLFGGHINDIQFIDDVYYIQLRLDEKRSYKKYFWEEDLNGKYIIYNSSDYDNSITADYAFVYFNLPYELPALDATLYVFGGFSNWELKPENKMRYNFEKEMYEGMVLLKQGVYNYSYVFVNNYIKEIDETAIEGSHFETENDYLVFVYYKGIGDNFDRLIGYQIVNSKYTDN